LIRQLVTTDLQLKVSLHILGKTYKGLRADSSFKMFTEILEKTIVFILLLLLPGFYMYSPTSTSTKIQSFLILSGLASYLFYPDAGKYLFDFAKTSVYEQPFKSAVIVIIISGIAKYLQRKLRFARINAIKMKYGYTDAPDTWENMTVEQAQKIERNMAEWEFPRLWQFAWISGFLRVSTAGS